MTRDLRQKIASHYYNLGCEVAMQTKTSSAKDVARAIGQISAQTLPSLGALGGIAGGGYLGLNLGVDIARSVAQHAATEGDHFGRLAVELLGTPALGGAGLAAGSIIGGLGGSKVGRGTKEVLLDALRKKA